MNRFVNYATYIVFLMALVAYYLVLDQPSAFALKLSPGGYSQRSEEWSRHLSMHFSNFHITNINQAARLDQSIRKLQGRESGDDDERYMPRLQVRFGDMNFAKANHWWLFGNYANSDIAQLFVIGMFSIVPVNHEGEPGALVVGRGTFVGVPFVVFAYQGEIVHVTTSNGAALDYFIEHWQ